MSAAITLFTERRVSRFNRFYRAMLCIRGTSHGPVSVCLCLSQAGVLLKRQNVESQKQHHTIPQGLYFSDAKDLREIRPGSPLVEMFNCIVDTVED